jgi:predicted short-subunit dehydrogenase-like oxidoreductase (DUF2520 family)
VARKLPTVSIVGAGRVGGAIGLALANAGYPITAAWSRSRGGRQRAHRLLDVPVLEPAEVAAAADVVFLSVPDDAIVEMAEQIAPVVHKGQFVVHTSGGTSIDALSAVRDAGARIGCLHPLQTIPDAERGAEALNGSSVAVTCESAERLPLMRLARAWGGRPFVLADEAKRVYHAAAVFASNYVVSSIWAATTLMQSLGIRNAADILGPLVRGSVENVLTRGGVKAITGPVVRGDAELVKRHIAALREADPTDHAITDAYRALAKLTAALAGGDVERFAKATT